MLESPHCGVYVDTEDESLRESVLRQYAGLRKLMADIPKDASNQSKFNNWIGEIKVRVDSDAEAADHSLHALYRQLREAPDGTGGFILNAERHSKYLDPKGGL
jgi:hypothetical protein